MPILDPGRKEPEVIQAVDLDLTREQPTTDQVKLDITTPVGSVNALIRIGGLVAPGFTFLTVGAVAAALAYTAMHVSLTSGAPGWMSPPAALVAMTITFWFGLPVVDRQRGK